MEQKGNQILPRGTPKTLLEAIENGSNDAYLMDNGYGPKVIRAHVEDFLNQRFAVALLKAEGSPVFELLLVDLLKSIVNHEVKP